MILATLALGYVLTDFAVRYGHYRYYESYVLIAAGLGLYAFCYAISALTVRRLFFAKSLRRNLTTMIALILVTVGSIGPMLVGFFLRPNRWNVISPIWFIANPFVVFWEKAFRSNCIAFTSIWAIGVAALNAPWLIRQFRSFRPLEAQPLTEAVDE